MCLLENASRISSTEIRRPVDYEAAGRISSAIRLDGLRSRIRMIQTQSLA